MKDIILVNICEDHTWECSTNIIGRTGESCSSQFNIFLTKEAMCSCLSRLEFKKPSGQKYKTPYLTIENNIIIYDIPKILLTEEGKLQVQLILEKESGEVWESSVKSYYVLESIDADSEISDIGITPTGDIDITSNGTYNVTTYANANVEVKGEPYEFETEEQMTSFLGNPHSQLGDVVKYNNEYYVVENDGVGTEKYYTKLSGGSEGTNGGSNGAKIVTDNWQGTTVPNTGTINKWYINNNLSVDEVKNIFTQIASGEGFNQYIVTADTEGTNAIMALIINGEVGLVCYINGVGEETPIFASSNDIGFDFIGFNPEITNFNFDVNYNSVSEMDGMLVGDKNDLLNSLFSTTPFIQKAIELSGEYEGKKITTSETEINLEKLINEKKIPTSIKVVSSGSLDITENGEYNVSSYGKVNVNVMPIEITENGDGTVDLTILENTDISVAENDDGSVDITIPTE